MARDAAFLETLVELRERYEAAQSAEVLEAAHGPS